MCNKLIPKCWPVFEGIANEKENNIPTPASASLNELPYCANGVEGAEVNTEGCSTWGTWTAQTESGSREPCPPESNLDISAGDGLEVTEYYAPLLKWKEKISHSKMKLYPHIMGRGRMMFESWGIIFWKIIWSSQSLRIIHLMRRNLPLKECSVEELAKMGLSWVNIGQNRAILDKSVWDGSRQDRLLAWSPILVGWCVEALSDNCEDLGYNELILDKQTWASAERDPWWRLPPHWGCRESSQRRLLWRSWGRMVWRQRIFSVASKRHSSPGYLQRGETCCRIAKVYKEPDSIGRCWELPTLTLYAKINPEEKRRKARLFFPLSLTLRLVFVMKLAFLSLMWTQNMLL